MNVEMLVYECTDCVLTFAIEKQDGLFEIVCPLCQSEEAVDEKGPAVMSVGGDQVESLSTDYGEREENE